MDNTNTTSYKLADSSISQIAKLLQLAIITGTDIVDNLRTLRLSTGDNNSLVPDVEYLSQFEDNLNKMVGHLNESQNNELYAGEEN